MKRLSFGLFAIFCLLACASCKTGNRSKNPLATASFPKPDVTAANFQAGQTTFKSGDQVNFTWTVENVGNKETGQFRYGLYSSSDNTVDVNDTLLFPETVQNLDKNTNRTINDKFIVNVQPGTYFWAIIADDQNVLTEWTKGNNTSTPVVQITIN